MSRTVSSTTASKPLRCPRCGSTQVANFLYGMPIMSKALEKRLAKGTTILGGCIVKDDASHHRCVGCEHEWSEISF